MISDDTRYHIGEALNGLRWDLYGKQLYRAKHTLKRSRYQGCRPKPRRVSLERFSLEEAYDLLAGMRPLSHIVAPKRAKGEVFQYTRGVIDWNIPVRSTIADKSAE